MQTRVVQIALSKGFPNIPHIPLPPEHSVDTNEATMAPTPENPESWHNPQRPRERERERERERDMHIYVYIFISLSLSLGVFALCTNSVGLQWLSSCRGGMWGIFGKPLKRAIQNTPGLHAGLPICLRFSSVLDGVCAACCPVLSTGSYHVFIQIHSTGCCFP